jgi:hypothetical protein
MINCVCIINTKNENGNTTFHLAATRNVGFVLFLVSQNTVVNVENKKKHTFCWYYMLDGFYSHKIKF